MSNEKEIRIRAVLDASTFDKGVNEIQEKLKKLTQQQSQGSSTTKQLGNDSVLGKYAQQAFGDFSKESQKQLETMYQTQRREAVNQTITMKGKQAELAQMSKIDGEMTKQQKERVTLLQKEIELLKEKRRETLVIAGETQKQLDKMKPAAAGGGNSGSGGGIPGGTSESAGGGAADMFKKYLQNITMGAGAAALYKGAMNVASDAISREGTMLKLGGATSGILTKQAREEMQGQGIRGQYWNAERIKSIQGAARQSKGERYTDAVNAVGTGAVGALAGGYAGMSAGAYIGGGIGALAGPLGALAGAGIGGVAGAIGGAYLGANATTSEKSRARLFDQEKYNKMKGKEFAEDQDQRLAAEKALNYKKDMALSYMEENGDRLKGLSRSLGQDTDNQLMGLGGTLQNGMKTGGQYGGSNFSQRTIEEQIQALASGGAMTEGLNGLGGAAATYNRQFNLSNAGQTMGRMQGNTGMNSAQTDMAYQRIMTEAVRLGINVSEMPKEMEKMTQMTAELATSGGGFAGGAAQLLGAGLTGYDQKSMSSAQNAFGEYESAAKESGGWRGQMGMSYLQSDKGKKAFGNMSAKNMNMINQLSFADMPEEDYQRYADYLGISKEQFVSGMKQKDQYKQSMTSGGDKEFNALGEYYKSQGANTPEKRKALRASGKGAELFTAAQATMGQQGDMAGKDSSQIQALIDQRANMSADYEPGKSFDEAGKEINARKNKATGKTAELMEGAESTGNLTNLNNLTEKQDGNLNTFLEQMKTAAKTHTQTAELYNAQQMRLVEASRLGADKLEEVAKNLDALAASMNLHSGSPSGGH